MCGLAAFFEPNKNFSDYFLNSIDKDLFHRGPDSGGIHSESGIGLVFRRLAIIDPVKNSNQPMTSKCGLYTIIFNGEIYNYKDLRYKLSKSGIEFKTNSDTEVLLEGYRVYGSKILGMLEGMFAFVVVDRKRGIALGVRDPFGIKPLYFTKHGKISAFSSEMRVFSRLRISEPDPSVLPELLTYKWAAGESSNELNVIRVEGGSAIEINLSNGDQKKFIYKNILDLLKEEKENNISNVERSVIDSIKNHLISDVGYSTQLSGGVDSSLITAIASKNSNKAISAYGVKIGEKNFDESHYRKMVSEIYPINQYELNIDSKKYADALPDTIKSIEGPSSHGGCVALWLLCKKIGESNKVVLTGEGADELFGGYERYGMWKKLSLQEKLSRLPFTKLFPNKYPFMGIKRFLNKDAAIYSAVYDNIEYLNDIFPDILPAPFGYRNKISSKFSDFRDRLYAVDHKSYLESLLIRQDKISMASSVETRVPFVHLPLWKSVSSLSHNLRTPGKTTKPILKNLAVQYLPKELVFRRKIGLVLPYNKWYMDENGLGRFLDLLKESNSPVKSIASKSKIDNLVDKFRLNNNWEISKTLNKLVNIDTWLRSFKDKPKVIKQIYK